MRVGGGGGKEAVDCHVRIGWLAGDWLHSLCVEGTNALTATTTIETSTTSRYIPQVSTSAGL